jgi:hypothetical protein
MTRARYEQTTSRLLAEWACIAPVVRLGCGIAAVIVTAYLCGS